ncbi:hypothetical protein HCN44_010078 [Aphidius gifuensis]|uniref:Uncharacterized protein n=1 Tax=Aphidius gifuensis TaxID=684658 RepID=A0A835CTN6_APHGI|nr:hypothetical protein HCN44_010078 [Aphidius gifuensis]
MISLKPSSKCIHIEPWNYYFFQRVLEWEPKWFDNYNDNITTSQILGDNLHMSQTKLFYNTIEEYQETMKPLIVHEFFHTLMENIDDDDGSTYKRRRRLVGEIGDNIPSSEYENFNDTPYEENLVTISQYFKLTEIELPPSEDINNNSLPQRGDLLHVIYNETKVFGYLDKVVKKKRTDYDYFYVFTVITKLNISFPNNEIIRLTSVKSLQQTLRIMYGLEKIQDSPLFHMIMKPDINDYIISQGKPFELDEMMEDNLNPSESMMENDSNSSEPMISQVQISNINVTDKTAMFDFFDAIFGWDPQWFDDPTASSSRDTVTMAQILGNNCPVLNSTTLCYDNEEEYYYTMIPLIIHEFFYGLMKDINEDQDSPSSDDDVGKISNRKVLGIVKDSQPKIIESFLTKNINLRFKIIKISITSKKFINNDIFPRRGDLVKLKYFKKKIFAYVHDINTSEITEQNNRSFIHVYTVITRKKKRKRWYRNNKKPSVYIENKNEIQIMPLIESKNEIKSIPLIENKNEIKLTPLIEYKNEIKLTPFIENKNLETIGEKVQQKIEQKLPVKVNEKKKDITDKQASSNIANDIMKIINGIAKLSLNCDNQVDKPQQKNFYVNNNEFLKKFIGSSFGICRNNKKRKLYNKIIKSEEKKAKFDELKLFEQKIKDKIIKNYIVFD